MNEARLEASCEGHRGDAATEVKRMQCCDNVLLFLLFATALKIIMSLISKSSIVPYFACMWHFMFPGGCNYIYLFLLYHAGIPNPIPLSYCTILSHYSLCKQALDNV